MRGCALGKAQDGRYQSSTSTHTLQLVRAQLHFWVLNTFGFPTSDVCLDARKSFQHSCFPLCSCTALPSPSIWINTIIRLVNGTSAIPWIMSLWLQVRDEEPHALDWGFSFVWLRSTAVTCSVVALWELYSRCYPFSASSNWGMWFNPCKIIFQHTNVSCGHEKAPSLTNRRSSMQRQSMLCCPFR